MMLFRPTISASYKTTLKLKQNVVRLLAMQGPVEQAAVKQRSPNSSHRRTSRSDWWSTRRKRQLRMQRVSAVEAILLVAWHLVTQVRG